MMTIFPSLSRLRAQLVHVTVCLLVGACSGPSPDASRPNIVLISVDTLNRDALRAFASQAPSLPAFDRLAADATRFTRAYAPASWTLPSHTSVFTGRYPNRHGVVRIGQALPAELPLLQSILSDAGYQTLAFTDGALLDPAFGHSRGFQFYDDLQRNPASPLREDIPRHGAPHPDPSVDIFDRAIAYLDQRQPGDPPFFLFTHTFAVHDYPRYDRRDMKPLENAPNDMNCLLGRAQCSADHWTELRKLYDARVKAVDQALGRFLAAIERDSPDTIVILFSDHGEGFDAERARTHHAGRLHEDLIEVPMLVRIPGVAGRNQAGAVSLVDLMPTVLDLAGAAVPENLDGLSLKGLLESKSAEPLPPRAIYAMEYAYHWEDGTRTYQPTPKPLGVAVVDQRGWYIASPDHEELYASSGDPEQRVNLVSDSPDLPSFRELSAKATVWEAPESATVPIDAALEAHLRAIGYID